MTDQFLLWNTQRQGWVTAIGTTSTDHNQALEVDWFEAVERTKRHLDYQKTPGVVPVPRVMLQEAGI